MVVKRTSHILCTKSQFESSVISYGSQTPGMVSGASFPFESSVISYGSQTQFLFFSTSTPFESSVISYGSQTVIEQ